MTTTENTDLTVRVEALATQVDKLTNHVTALSSSLRSVQDEYDTFRATVASKIVELGDEHDFDADDVLDDLGLEKPTRTYRVTVELTATQEVKVKVEASSQEEAEGLIDNDTDLAWDVADPDDWDRYSTEVRYVEEA